MSSFLNFLLKAAANAVMLAVSPSGRVTGNNHTNRYPISERDLPSG
jgi:hypothetical protein